MSEVPGAKVGTSHGGQSMEKWFSEKARKWEEMLCLARDN